MALEKQVLHQVFSRVSGGAFEVAYWDGSRERYGAGAPGFKLSFRDAALPNLLSDDVVMWFGEAYMDGRIDVEGDLADVVALAIRNASLEADLVSAGVARALRDRVAAVRRSLRRQAKDVQRHYDLGNEFYRLWLDETMTYSCAYFRSPEDTLETAQVQKMDHCLRKLRLRPGLSLLDIGSGWGALVVRAAERYGSDAVGITLSEEQYAYSCAALQARGLEDRAHVRLAHYDTVAHEGRTFDRIVSVGMIEHVGKAHLGEFAAAVERILKPGGLALLHLITSPTDGPVNSWTERYIFPGGYIPTVSETIGHLCDHGLRIVDVENLRPHYAMTLDHWSARFERNASAVRERFGEKFERMWRLYLRGASASFREGALEVHQILVSKGKSDAVPLTREDLYQPSAAE